MLAVLKKHGHSRSGVSVGHGYHGTVAGKALKRPWLALEALIAEAIGIPAPQIWPGRYASGGGGRAAGNVTLNQN